MNFAAAAVPFMLRSSCLVPLVFKILVIVIIPKYRASAYTMSFGPFGESVQVSSRPLFGGTHGKINGGFSRY